MDGTEWKTSLANDSRAASASGNGQSVKPKRKSLLERELETSLTTKATLPSSPGDGGPTSRYGRVRKAKTDDDFSDTDQALKRLLKAEINSPAKPQLNENTAFNFPVANKSVKTEADKPTESEEIATVSSNSSVEGLKSTLLLEDKLEKVYVRKDLIQKTDTTGLAENTFSPSKSKRNSHINTILERSSEKYQLNTDTKLTNGYINNASVVKTLDFDSGKPEKSEVTTSSLSKSDLFYIEAKCAFQVGDLAWARVGTYPFWPCIVTREPFSDYFVKRKLFGRTERDILHVTFFADNGRRGWVPGHMLMPYSGLQEFEETRNRFTPEDKKKDPRLYAAFFISDKKKEIWNLSVTEAENFLREPKRNRIDMLIEMLSKCNVKNLKKPKSIKLGRKYSDVSLSESLFDTLFSEDDTKSEDAKPRSRNKSLDVSEVVTACLDSMAAKTGISMIQKQSHMDRWLQKAKSKTPEKPKSNRRTKPSLKTPDKVIDKRQSRSSRKRNSEKERSRGSRESHNIRACHVEHDYTKFDIENENPASNSNKVASDYTVDHREHVNGIRVENEVNKALNSDCNIEISIVDEVMDSKGSENIETKEQDIAVVENMDVDPTTDTVSVDTSAKVALYQLDLRKDATNVKIKVAEINDSIPQEKIDDYSELSEEFSPDIAFEEMNKSPSNTEFETKTKSSSKAKGIDLTISDSDESSKFNTTSVNTKTSKRKANRKSQMNKASKSATKKTTLKKSSPLNISIKTPDSLNQSICVSEDFSLTDISLNVSTPKKAKSTKVNTNIKYLSCIRTRKHDVRPKRKCAKQTYTIGGTDDPEFLIYLETHQDSILDENPDLSEKDLVHYLYKTWTYEQDIKTTLLLDDPEDNDVDETIKDESEKVVLKIENNAVDPNSGIITAKTAEKLCGKNVLTSETQNNVSVPEPQKTLPVPNHIKPTNQNCINKSVVDPSKIDLDSVRIRERKLTVNLQRENLEQKRISSKKYFQSEIVQHSIQKEVLKEEQAMENLHDENLVEEKDKTTNRDLELFNQPKMNQASCEITIEIKEEPRNYDNVTVKHESLEEEPIKQNVDTVTNIKDSVEMNAAKNQEQPDIANVTLQEDLEEKIMTTCNKEINSAVDAKSLQECEVSKSVTIQVQNTFVINTQCNQAHNITNVLQNQQVENDDKVNLLRENLEKKLITSSENDLKYVPDSKSTNSVSGSDILKFQDQKVNDKVITQCSEEYKSPTTEDSAKTNDFKNFMTNDNIKVALLRENLEEKLITSNKKDFNLATDSKSSHDGVESDKLNLKNQTDETTLDHNLHFPREKRRLSTKKEQKPKTVTKSKLSVVETCDKNNQNQKDDFNVILNPKNFEEKLNKPTNNSPTKQQTMTEDPNSISCVEVDINPDLKLNTNTKPILNINLDTMQTNAPKENPELVTPLESVSKTTLIKPDINNKSGVINNHQHVSDLVQNEHLQKKHDLINPNSEKEIKACDSITKASSVASVTKKTSENSITHPKVDLKSPTRPSLSLNNKKAAIESPKTIIVKKSQRYLNENLAKQTEKSKTIKAAGTIKDSSLQRFFSKTIAVKTDEKIKENVQTINEKDIPVPRKILIRAASKPIPKEPMVINEGFVDLTEEEDDEDEDDIPSPEFEIHTVDSKEKEFISELRKSILPELMKEIDFKIKKEEISQITSQKQSESIQKSNEIVSKSKDKEPKAKNDDILPANDKNNIDSDDDISLDSFTENTLLQSDEEENTDSERLKVFESIAFNKINDLKINNIEADNNKANLSRKANSEVNVTSPKDKSNITSLSKNRKLSLKKDFKDTRVNTSNCDKLKKTSSPTKPTQIDNIGDKELVFPIAKDSEKSVKPLVNGCVAKLKIKNITTQPFVSYASSDDEHKHKMEKMEVVPEPRAKRKQRSMSDSNRKTYNAFDDPEFMLYVESRQDAVMDENPELSEEDVVKYLHKTWMYEQGLKSDRQKDDDIEQTNLVKGLVTQIVKPKKVKRTTSGKIIPVVRIERMDLRERKVESKRRVPNGIVEDESSDSDCEIITNRDLDTISILSEKDTVSEYIPSDEESETSSLNTEEDVGFIKMKSKVFDSSSLDSEEISLAKVKSQIDLEDEGKPITCIRSKKVTKTNDPIAFKESCIIKTESDEPKESKLGIPTINQTEDLITLDDLNIIENKHIPLDAMLSSPLSSPIKSDASEGSRPKRTQRTKIERNPNFPSAREVNSALDDPDFLKYLELRQDALLEENPHVTQDDLVKYLYKTWVYEQNLKTETELDAEIENANLVKGLNDQPIQPKKIRKKIKDKEVKEEKEFKIEKEVKKENDADIPPNDKPKRKAANRFYHEDETDVEDELEVFEIFKPKNKPKKEPSSSEVKTESTDVTVKSDELESVEPEEEALDDIETYFLKLTQSKPNVFKGLTRERVCEICFKTGKLVKCKGACCGTFHIDCVKNGNVKEEEVNTPQSTRGRKKKKNRACPWLLGKKPENLDESQSDEKETSDEPVMVIDADDFEAKLSAKMKEILNTDEVIELDSSSDEDITWRETQPGKCEIIDVKLKIKKPAETYDDFKCNHCQSNETPLCFICKSTESPKNNIELRQRCQFAHCHKFYHVECLDHWPQTQIKDNQEKVVVSLTCPRHVCHSCVSDDPRGCQTRFSGDKLAKCVKCPATYHSFTKCLPAGSEILSASHIICPRHHDLRPGKVPCHVNTGWCFICAEGGTLICCEYCPTSFHAECLQIKPPEGNYMCEDCETGRLPLYGEMVWVKLGHYRWWPGIVLHPTEIPDNIKAIKHSHGEFVVRFFGQYDHYWVNRGRVFPFQEGDSGRISSQKSKIDEAFTVAIEHASRAFQILKNAPPNEEEDTDIQSSLLPPHYVKLRVNKPVGSLINKKIEDLNSLTQCECDPRESDPCGVDSQCLNRMLLTECGPTCAAADRCRNRMFERRQYPRLAAHRAAHRGWGLRALEDIPAGRFVIEYVGELVDETEFQRRMRSKHAARDENYYFLTLDKDRVIDAGPKGNLARFMNHSCEPNCETQKWTVLGDVRVGLFALYNIPANSELTFNYNLECTGIEKKRCLCGARRCSGYIGAKPKTLEETQPKKTKLQKRSYKKRDPKKGDESTPPKKLGRPRKQKELTELEKDLLIIKNATNSVSSDSETSSRLNSVETEDRKALKRKRDEVILYNSDSSPMVKRVKTDDSDSVSDLGIAPVI